MAKKSRADVNRILSFFANINFHDNLLQQFLAKALRDVLWHQKRMQVIARANLINNSEGVPSVLLGQSINTFT